MWDILINCIINTLNWDHGDMAPLEMFAANIMNDEIHTLTDKAANALK